MVIVAVLSTFEAMLGNVGAILALSWEDLAATWVHLGTCESKPEKNTYFVERCDGVSTDVLMIDHCLVDRLKMGAISKH